MAIKFEFFESESLLTLQNRMEEFMRYRNLLRQNIVKIHNHSVVHRGHLMNKVMLAYEDAFPHIRGNSISSDDNSDKKEEEAEEKKKTDGRKNKRGPRGPYKKTRMRQKLMEEQQQKKDINEGKTFDNAGMVGMLNSGIHPVMSDDKGDLEQYEKEQLEALKRSADIVSKNDMPPEYWGTPILHKKDDLADVVMSPPESTKEDNYEMLGIVAEALGVNTMDGDDEEKKEKEKEYYDSLEMVVTSPSAGPTKEEKQDNNPNNSSSSSS